MRSRLPLLALGGGLLALGALGGTLLGRSAPGVAAPQTVTLRLPAAARETPAPRGVRVPVTVFPTAADVARARHWLRGRAGRTAFAVVDGDGRLRGTRVHDRFHSASLVKAMLLVAYLRGLDATDQPLAPGAGALLGSMIRVSDNDAASTIFALVGQRGLEQLARDAGMADFSSSPAWGWSEISAADQARFFALLDRLVPARYAGLAHTLLAGVVASQSWGIPAAARPAGFTVLFKGGWLEGIVNQAARIEGHGRTFALAVLTDANPSMAYGEETLRGLTAALIAR